MDKKIELMSEKFWNELNDKERINLLSTFQFWNGLGNYYYNYLPEELKIVLRCEVTKNITETD